MSLYQNLPACEMKIGHNGALLCASAARYASLQEYIFQMGAPLSMLPGIGAYMFADPITPACWLLVGCVLAPLCDRCLEALEDCSCSF